MTGEGCDLLLKAISEKLIPEAVIGHCKLPYNMGRLRARLHRLNAIRAESFDDSGNYELTLRLSQADWNQALHSEGINADELAFTAEIE